MPIGRVLGAWIWVCPRIFGFSGMVGSVDDFVSAMQAQIAALAQIFRPSAPTDDVELLIGRTDQLSDLTQTAHEPGRHAIVFGERGVGKTSVANAARVIFEAQADMNMALRIPCSADDDFCSVWRKILARLRNEIDERPDVAPQLLEIHDRVEDFFVEDPTPDSVARALAVINRSFPLLVVIDEFDRLPYLEPRTGFADLIKMVSDDQFSGTVVIVGVADTVGELLTEHASIERALRQVHMPRMTVEELCEVVRKGFRVFRERTGVAISIEDEAVRVIAQLSQGFPYYTHLLAGSVGRNAIKARRETIATEDVIRALVLAADEADPSIREAYKAATDAARSHATYEETLMACAMTEGDNTGFFAAADIAPHLSVIHGAPKKQPQYNAHLSKFSQEPPRILERRHVAGRYRYRFTNPLMKPFVLMNGYKLGMLNFTQDGRIGDR